MGEVPPLAPRAEAVRERVADPAQGVAAVAVAGEEVREGGLEYLPGGVGEVGGVGLASHAPEIAPALLTFSYLHMVISY